MTIDSVTQQQSLFSLNVTTSLQIMECLPGSNYSRSKTWCNENYAISLGQITPPDYSVIHTHRQACGGGVALIFRDTYKTKHVKTG